MTDKVIFLTSTGAHTWSPPSDFSPTNTIECIGAGGTGGVTSGGVGGSYAKVSNWNSSGCTSIGYTIGTTVSGASGNTWFGAVAQASAPVMAKGGGQSGSSVGDITYAGGASGVGPNSGSLKGGGGGGGAAGPNGPGNPGVNGSGSAAGAGGSGDAGSGGAAGSAGGGTGSPGNEWTQTSDSTTAGSGGGGGGGLSSTPGPGGAGGLYGAAGGGSGEKAGVRTTEGPGKQGLIVITYTPARPRSFGIVIG